MSENSDMLEKKETPIPRYVGICRDCGVRVSMNIWELYGCKCIRCGRPELTDSYESD